jgi:hypothetical protein
MDLKWASIAAYFSLFNPDHEDDATGCEADRYVTILHRWGKYKER